MSNYESRSTAERAYLIWEQMGRPDGQALEHWLRAEAEPVGEPAASMPSPHPAVGKPPRRGRRKQA